MSAKPQFVFGQRVRVEEEEEPGIHVGKLGFILSIESTGGTISYKVKVDHFEGVITLPEGFLEELKVYPSSLLANNLFLPWDIDDPARRFEQFLGNNGIAGSMLETLLFYDRVVIPTVDFAIVVPLIHWLGPELFTDMLVSEAVSFVRFRGGLGYLGGGNGLALFEIHPGDKPEPWYLRSARCNPSEAVVLQLSNRLQGLAAPAMAALGKLVEVCTQETSLVEFTSKVEHETYTNILESSDLRDRFAIRNTNLKHLLKLPGNQTRMFTFTPKPTVAGDEIDVTLRLAMANLESYLAEESGARDMTTDSGFSFFLQAKANKYRRNNTTKDSFAHFRNINRIPSLDVAISGGEVSPAKAWAFRNSRVAGQFRGWFDKHGPEDPIGLEREYIESLRMGGFWGTRKAKTLRFITTQAIGLALVPATAGISLGLTLAVGIVDGFFLEKLHVEKFAPRYFVDDINQTLFNQ